MFRYVFVANTGINISFCIIASKRKRSYFSCADSALQPTAAPYKHYANTSRKTPGWTAQRELQNTPLSLIQRQPDSTRYYRSHKTYLLSLYSARKELISTKERPEREPELTPHMLWRIYYGRREWPPLETQTARSMRRRRYPAGP